MLLINILPSGRKCLVEACTGREQKQGDLADSGNRDASITYVCPDCGAAMLIIETFERGQLPRAPPNRSNVS